MNMYLTIKISLIFQDVYRIRCTDLKFFRCIMIEWESLIHKSENTSTPQGRDFEQEVGALRQMSLLDAFQEAIVYN